MKKLIIFSLLFVILVIFISCSSAPTITKVTSLVPISDVDKKITKNGITIEVEPVNPTNLNKYPILTPTITYQASDFLLGPVEKKWVVPNVLNGLTFALNITNNTGHIVKMADSDVGLTIRGTDAPKLSKEQIKQQWAASFATNNQAIISQSAIIYSAIDQVPYWDENLKVLPGKTLKAFVTFNVALQEGIGEASLAIYDLVTNTDEAGNPIERTNFTFNLKEVTTSVSNQ